MSKLYLSTREVGALLGVSDQTVRNWISLGVLRGYQFNPNRGRILIKLADVDDAFEKGLLRMSDNNVD